MYQLSKSYFPKLLTSNAFGSFTSDTCKAIADLINYTCIKEIKFQNNTSSLETCTPSRIVHRHKNADLRQIGVLEVLCKLAGEVVMSTVTDDVTKTVENLHLCDWKK